MTGQQESCSPIFLSHIYLLHRSLPFDGLFFPSYLTPMVLFLGPYFPNTTADWDFLSPFCYGPFLKCQQFGSLSATHQPALKFLWEWKNKEEKGEKVRNKGNVILEPSERGWEAPEVTWSVPGK